MRTNVKEGNQSQGVKKVAYKEPAAYFNSDMRKAAELWEKENAMKKKGTGNSLTENGRRIEKDS